MQIVENYKLFKILLLTRSQLISTGGYAICDNCCKPMQQGYYIAVLNMTYCQMHYEKWIETAINHPEDNEYENFAYNRMYEFITKISSEK